MPAAIRGVEYGARVDQLQAAIIDVPDFPKPGVRFRDITPVLASPALFSLALDRLGAKVKWNDLDVVVGIESRGFILGAALAARHGKGFVPMRKAGKLPGPVVSQTYSLEYGQATLELKPGTGRALVIDDVLATGGTLEAALSLCARAGYEVVDLGVLINLSFLNTFTFRGQPVPAAISY